GPAARPVPGRRCRPRTPPRGRDGLPRPRGGRPRRGGGVSQARGRPRPPSPNGRTLPRARPGLELRAVGRELRRGRARGDVAVDLLLRVRYVVPRRAPGRGNAAARKAL